MKDNEAGRAQGWCIPATKQLHSKQGKYQHEEEEEKEETDDAAH